MEEEADKAILWSALTRLDDDTRGQLESLYWEQDGGTDKVKIQDTKEYTRRVWDVLQQHECAIESLLRTLAVLFALGSAPMVLSACGEPPPAVVVSQQTLEVGCGTCIFQQEGGVGCYWAAKVGEDIYPMKGEVLPSEKEYLL